LLGYFLLTLLPLAVVIYVVWTYRKRRAERIAASSKRFSDIFGSAPKPIHSPPASVAAAVSSVPASYVKKDKLLDPHHALLFHILVSSLPEHAIFVHVSLAAIVDLPPGVQGREREQRLRALSANAIDCLVCNKAMEAIAAVDIEDGVNVASRIKSEYLKSARVRYLRVNPAALPAAHEIQALLLGT
jgi:intracellular sulfur oxidation DsrE/DsrF family protein